jgi:hypothetical protein
LTAPTPAGNTAKSARRKARATPRGRVLDLLADDRAEHVIPSVRIANGSAQPSTWRDPSDSNPNRRVPRVVDGHRAYDTIAHLKAIGTLTRGHAETATRFRREHELAQGVMGSSKWERQPATVGPSGGPSQGLMQSLERWRPWPYRCRASMC